ncbi:transposase [Aurantimonas coralicida]|uniref:transposase n=1 Tax=Aurantimonas coralicida TaxID=182270 RepID=UPI003CC7D990
MDEIVVFAAWCGDHGARNEDIHVTYHRIDLVRDSGRRRHWPTALKEEIVMSALEEDASVVAVARRYDVDPSSICRWIRKFRLDAQDRGRPSCLLRCPRDRTP